MNTRKAQVHALPTERASVLTKNSYKFTPEHGNPWDYNKPIIERPFDRGYIPHHIYFTTDVEIKDGNWVIEKNTLYKASIYDADDIKPKVVATTNPELWKDMTLGEVGAVVYQGRTDLLKVAKIGEDFIEAFVREQGNIKEVLLETEDTDNSYEEWTPDGMKEFFVQRLKLRPNGTVVIHPVKEKTITPEEMYLNMQYYMEYCGMKGYVTPQTWLAEHKHF